MQNLEKNKRNKLVYFMRKRVDQGKLLHPGTYDKFIQRKVQRNDELSRKELEIRFGNMEKHHIIPKHQGGSDKEDNLVLLTNKEHMIAHKILYMEFAQVGEKLLFFVYIQTI